MEGLALVVRETIDEQPLSFRDPVLLAADSDHCVAHSVETRAFTPANDAV